MVTLRDAASAIKAATQAGRGNVVPPEELQRRAAICERCPMRQFVGAGALDRASQVLGMMVNRHRVPKSLTTYKCGVCGCSLMMLLPARTEDLHKDTPEQASYRKHTAPGCWV